MSAWIIFLTAIGCASGGFAAGAAWCAHFSRPDSDYDLNNWSDFQ